MQYPIHSKTSQTARQETVSSSVLGQLSLHGSSSYKRQIENVKKTNQKAYEDTYEDDDASVFDTSTFGEVTAQEALYVIDGLDANAVFGTHAQAEIRTDVSSDASGSTAPSATNSGMSTASYASDAWLSWGTLGLMGAGLGLITITSPSGGGNSPVPTDISPPDFSNGITKAVSITENAAISNVVYDAQATDNGGAADVGITYALSGADADRFVISAAGEVTLKVVADFEAKASYAINVVATDAAGNSSIQAITVNVIDLNDVIADITPPTATLKAEALTNNGNAVVQSSETGTAYLVKNTHTVGSLADITNADDNLWNSVAVGAANADTNLSVSGLLAGVYKLYTADAEGNLSAVASDTVVVSNTSTTAMSLNAGTADTDYGNLIAPVYVDKNWYFAWDLNGDGTQNTTQDTSGKFNHDGSTANASGTGYQRDFMTHDVLDGIFRYDSAGNLETSANAVGAVGDTDNTFRFGSLNGVKLALPTIGNGETTATTFGHAAGTATDNNPAGETNLTYDDLLAIWDGHNGSGTGTNVGGTPSGWLSADFWSATPFQAGHAELFFFDGYVNLSTYANYVSNAAVQVL